MLRLLVIHYKFCVGFVKWNCNLKYSSIIKTFFYEETKNKVIESLDDKMTDFQLKKYKSLRIAENRRPTQSRDTTRSLTRSISPSCNNARSSMFAFEGLELKQNMSTSNISEGLLNKIASILCKKSAFQLSAKPSHRYKILRTRHKGRSEYCELSQYQQNKITCNLVKYSPTNLDYLITRKQQSIKYQSVYLKFKYSQKLRDYITH